MTLASFRLALAWIVILHPDLSAAEPGLVFSLKTWDGDYASKDIPGGVQSTPWLGSIYSINADGSGMTQIVPPGAGTDYPVASPDGKWVYYQSKVNGRTLIFRCRPDGTGTVNLTSPDELTKRLQGLERFVVKDAYGIGLSKDGAKLVFTVHDGSTGRAVIANANGTSPKFLAPGLGYTYMARLSPANDRAVFSGPARGYRLQIVTLSDGKSIELTPDHPDCYVPQFTPDGKTIVFLRRDGDIYRVDSDGKNLRRITEGHKYVEFRLSAKDTHGSTDGPDLSPDGKRIACIAVIDGVPNVCIVGSDGGNRRVLTSRKSACGRVKWSPDGKELSFVSFEGKYPQLFVVPATGGAPRQLTRTDWGVNFAHWKPE